MLSNTVPESVYFGDMSIEHNASLIKRQGKSNNFQMYF